MNMSETFEFALGNIIVYGVFIAILLKLLRLDKLAFTVFQGALIAPIVICMLITIVAIPIAVLYLTLGYFLDSHSLKLLLSVAITAIIFLLYFAGNSTVASNKDKLKEAYWNAKFSIEYFFKKYVLAEAEVNSSLSHIQILDKLDNKLKKEIANKFWYFLLAIAFYALSYQLLKENQSFYQYMNWRLSSWEKYSLIVASLALFLYLYSLYYSRFPREIFTKLMDLVGFLDKEKQYVLLIDSPKSSKHYSFFIDKLYPWKDREGTNYYYFCNSSVNEIAYWIKPSLDFKHYINVTSAISREGVEGLLDKVLLKSKTAAK